jgi:hypothetical protein
MSDQPSFRTDIGEARTTDGFVFYEQPDGSYTDGDLYFANSNDLLSNNPGTIISFRAPIFRTVAGQ